MFAKIMKLKNRKTKGFTLVELIIVLIILGILAALLLPTLTGYIDRAHEEAAVAECRMGVMSAKTLGAQTYETAFKATTETAKWGGTDGKPKTQDIKSLAEYTNQTIHVTYDKSGALTEFQYANGQYQVVFKDGGYTTTKNSASLDDVVNVTN